MRHILVALLAVVACNFPPLALGQSDPKQDRRVEAFVAGIHELDPRVEESKARFQELVQQFVPADGPAATFLEFMKASGFTCPWVHSLAPEVTRENPSYSCELDVSPTEPSFTSVQEVQVFYVTANCDTNRTIVSVDADVFYGLTGL